MFHYLLEAKLILLMYYIKLKVFIRYCCNCHYYKYMYSIYLLKSAD